MPWRHSLPFATLLFVVTAATATAQPPLNTQYEHATRCTSLSMVGGISSAESNAGGLVGAAAGWQITSRFGFEVDASWIDRAASEAGFAAGLHARWTLVSGSRAAPFLKTGGGLYHASFETGDDTVPAFYRDRLGDNDVGLSFTDPALIAGGGLDLLVSRRISLRPEANAMFVFDHGTSRVMPAFTLHLTFHFEEYPISPARK